ncbi:uncharacterized protein DDB_G0283697-like [Papaver somniferum]|uniref:uncharacterized protein DDB_G0283697-like n=1 Tax=Papaver somniferum TaxID=3469 RepID=UPI000E6F8FE8|nr:uncharacterized protein DDB_G0283697-like [Papaver somniferum]
MAENASSSTNRNHNEPPPDSNAMVRAKLTIGTLSSSDIERLIPFLNQEKIRKQEQEEREEFERLRDENDEEFQLWMRNTTESDSEDEEKNREGVEDEESSDDSMKRDDRAKEAERKKRKRKDFEDVMYKCYLAEKKNNPRKFARTMSEPMNVDSDGEEIPELDLDGEPVFSGGEMVVCSEVEDEEEETEDDDLQGPYASSDNDDGTGTYYEDDELNYSSNRDGDSW